MDVWMDGRTRGWVSGWAYGRMDSWVARQMDRWMLFIYHFSLRNCTFSQRILNTHLLSHLWGWRWLACLLISSFLPLVMLSRS